MKTISNTARMIIYISIVILSISCETDVSDDIDLVSSPPKLAINGGLERTFVNVVLVLHW